MIRSPPRSTPSYTLFPYPTLFRSVHMLALLIQQRLREAALPAGPVESYRLILGDPLQLVQRLLGHASLTTTYIYLDHIATRADTVDAAVEELLALLPGPQGARSEEHTSELQSLMRSSYAVFC